MKTLQFALAALCCAVAPVAAAEPGPLVSIDYAQAFSAGRSSHRLVAVAVGLNGWHWPRDYAGHILCRVPASHVYRAGAHGVRLIEQAGFRLLGGAGIVVIDPLSGHAISVLPRRYCTPGGIDALMRLPRGTLTQRTLIWAVMTHPERPQSAYGRPSQRLFSHAAANNWKQIKHQWPGHYLPISQFGNASEVSAVSWPESVNVVDGAVDIVKSWRHSAGHWRHVVAHHAEFGYDMQCGGGKWYATGTFRD